MYGSSLWYILHFTYVYFIQLDCIGLYAHCTSIINEQCQRPKLLLKYYYRITKFEQRTTKLSLNFIKFYQTEQMKDFTFEDKWVSI